MSLTEDTFCYLLMLYITTNNSQLLYNSRKDELRLLWVEYRERFEQNIVNSTFHCTIRLLRRMVNPEADPSGRAV